MKNPHVLKRASTEGFFVVHLPTSGGMAKLLTNSFICARIKQVRQTLKSWRLSLKQGVSPNRPLFGRLSVAVVCGTL